MVIVAAFTGMRFEEIAALSWEQVDLTRNKLRIDRTLSKGENKSYRVKMSPKTEADNRTIPLAPAAVQILRVPARGLSTLIFPSTVGTNRRGVSGNASALSGPKVRHSARVPY